MRGKRLVMGRWGAATVVILIAFVFISCSASWPVSVSSSSWKSTESTSGEDDVRFDNFLGMKILKREAALPPGYLQSQLQSTPSLSYGGVAPSLAQGPVIENLPQGQNEIFSSLTSSSPDMFYFSPRDQVLYKVSRLPLDNFNGGAAGLNLGATGTTATTSATTLSSPPATVQSSTPPSSPFNIGFEVEEETGGEYVGGFGGSSSTTTTTPAPATPVAPVVTPSGGGAGVGGGSVATPNVENSSFMTQLINAAAAARPPTPGPGPAPGLVMPASVEAMPGSGSGYRSKDTDDVSSESEYGYTPGGYGNLRLPSSIYGSQTEQFSQVVLPPQIRISPELSAYLTRLRNQTKNSIGNSGSGSRRNSVFPSSTLPENLDAATGTPGQQQRRVFKRMNFRAGGAIG